MQPSQRGRSVLHTQPNEKVARGAQRRRLANTKCCPSLQLPKKVRLTTIHQSHRTSRGALLARPWLRSWQPEIKHPPKPSTTRTTLDETSSARSTRFP